MEEDKINTMEAHRDLSLENKLVQLPEVNRLIITQIFLLGDSSMHHFNEGYNRRYSPPMFPSPAFNNTMASNAVGTSIIQLAENQSLLFRFYSSRTAISDGCLQRDDMIQPSKGGWCPVCRHWCLWWWRPLEIWRMVRCCVTSLQHDWQESMQRNWWKSHLEPSKRHYQLWTQHGLMMTSFPS